MLYSQLFFKTRKQPPKNEISKNAQLLAQAGFVNKLMAGVYSILPLGLKVLKKIEQIIREEMNAIGGQEIFLPALHPSKNWKISGGWNTIDVLFKIKSRTKKNYVLGQSHEEIITPLIKEYCHSYKDLPIFVYQIQQKYRDELRAKSGILRGREFGMKDMYSFHLNQKDFEKFYQICKQAYLKIFKRISLDAKVTEASGGNFSEKISYEFMVLTPAGEDDILYCPHCNYCLNCGIAEIKEGEICPHCRQEKLIKDRASEVGNVFDLGQRYTRAFNFSVVDKNGKKVFPVMGCYGIGTTRLMGVIVEKFHDEKGIIWPISVTPYHADLITLTKEKNNEKFYNLLQENGFEILWDERDVSAGEKFADADLIGIPVRLVISHKNKNKIEWKFRDSEKKELLSQAEVIKRLKKIYD